MSRIPEQFWICFPYLYLHIYYNGNTRHLLDIAFDHLHLWWSIYRLESYFLKSNNWFCEKDARQDQKFYLSMWASFLIQYPFLTFLYLLNVFVIQAEIFVITFFSCCCSKSGCIPSAFDSPRNSVFASCQH